MRRVTLTAIAVLALVVASTGPLMFAQRLPNPEGIELSGSWAPRNFTDAIGNAPGPGAGPTPVDFAGIPLSEAGRANALSASSSKLSMPERPCDYYNPTYIVVGPMGFKMWSEAELRTGSTVAWVIGAWADYVPLPIWMDGRPQPSKYAPHTKHGFSAGVWENDVLKVVTTHMEAGVVRRNNTPISDKATMTEWFSRHGDILAVTARIDDPVDLAEPVYLTRDFMASATPLNPAAFPCTLSNEGIATGKVPHYAIGKNPFLNEMTAIYGIPVEATLGGPETMYPEFRKKIKDKYVRPDKCTDGNQPVPDNGCGRPGLYGPVN